MNVDENPQVPQKFRIMSIPTMIVFKDGKPVEQMVGVKGVKRWGNCNKYSSELVKVSGPEVTMYLLKTHS